MQREETDGIVISCDFCGTDWDEVKPMVEGHRGAVLCLTCLMHAVEQIEVPETSNADSATGKFTCPLCRRENIPADVPRWSHPNHGDTIACEDCIRQADGTFGKDPDVDYASRLDD